MWNDVIEYGIANGYWGHVRIMTERVSVSGIPGRTGWRHTSGCEQQKKSQMASWMNDGKAKERIQCGLEGRKVRE